MAQSAAVKVWADTARLARFGMHPTSRLALHVEEAWSALLHSHGVSIGERLRPMLASDLEASAQSMACVIVELPIREAVGQLPSRDKLEAVNDVREVVAAQARCWLFGDVRAAKVPGWSLVDLDVCDRLLQADNARVVPLFARFAEALGAG